MKARQIEAATSWAKAAVVALLVFVVLPAVAGLVIAGLTFAAAGPR